MLEMISLNLLQKSLIVSSVATSVALGFSTQAQAISFTEVGDAGDLLGTAQIINGNGSITDISGATSSANNDFVDLFQINLDGGFFSASTVGGSDFDTSLFLFDSNGDVLLSNDDDEFDFPESTISGNGLLAGIYYLGITGFNNLPIDAFSSIINDPAEFGGFDTNGTLAGWLEDDFTGSYTVSLAGASGVAEVPTPAAVLPILSGMFAAARRRKNGEKA